MNKEIEIPLIHSCPVYPLHKLAAMNRELRCLLFVVALFIRPLNETAMNREIEMPLIHSCPVYQSHKLAAMNRELRCLLFIVAMFILPIKWDGNEQRN